MKARNAGAVSHEHYRTDVRVKTPGIIRKPLSRIAARPAFPISRDKAMGMR